MKGWLDNFGKADNANESSVSLPEDFNGLAYDTKGRNYNPAWGGQFQQGGTLPGSVGFMYARTIDPAPSNGKYAKKTKASAQNGKEMQFYQEGLDWKPKSMQNGGDQISYNDPRYPELYKNRQVGAYYDGAYTLPDLDEVTVTAPRSYTMQSLRDATSAALYGAPANVMKLSSVPQAAMTEGIEMLRGRPYDFGNVNPNFGGFSSNQRDLSMTMGYENPEGFLQNAANIGLSMIDPSLISGLARRPIQKGLQQTGKFLTTKTPLKNTYKYNPWAFKPNPEMGYRMLGKEGFEDALETGVLRAKPAPNQSTTGSISLARNTNRNPNTGKMQGALDRPYFADGFIDERYAADYMAAVNKAENNLVSIPTHKGIAPPQAGSIPLENATIYKKDWLQGYKEIPKQEDGGIIKDDRGQWAHPGEITQVNSNYITMGPDPKTGKKIKHDLIGISDTGDVQYMTPGNDYKFKGKKVIEIPVAKLGINDLDAQPMKKLNQLTNFTNNPDKDNWLDKYQ